MDYPIKRSGYVYNKKTANGFQKMRNQGVIMPPIRIEDQVTRVLTSHYDRLLGKLETATQAIGLMATATTDSKLTTDGMFQEILAQLQDQLLRSIGSDKEKLEKRIAELLEAARDDFFVKLLEDADATIQTRVLFALDKDEVFQQRLDYLMQDYLLVSMDRIEWEENELKRRFLKEMSEYALGNVPDLKAISSVMADMKKTAVNEARFFSRDQFAKLNKSLTLASFEQAEVEYVEWLAVSDGRTRPTHKAVNHKVFRIDELPTDPKTGRPLHLDYNCRCSWAPVWK